MTSATRQSASTLFCYTVAGALAGLLFVGTLAVNTVDKVKVGSDLHSQIIEGKDLIADVLPPPAFILESFQVASQLLATDDASEVAKLCTSLERLEKEYEARIAVWQDIRGKGGSDRHMSEALSTLLGTAKENAD